MVGLTPVPEAGGIDFFSGRFDIDAPTCEGLLGLALEWGGEYADLFFEYNRQRSLTVEDGIVRQATRGMVQGLGVRVVRGEAVGYASTERFDAASMREAAWTAANIAKHGSGAEPSVASLRRVPTRNLYPVEIYSLDEPPATAVDLLPPGDAAARRSHRRSRTSKPG